MQESEDRNKAEREARAYLMGVAEPPARELGAFVELWGPVEAAARVRSGDVPPRVAAETAAMREENFLAADLAVAAERGMRLLIPEDDEWLHGRVESLARPGVEWRLQGSPLGLWALGSRPLAEAVGRAVSVVGTDAPTAYGAQLASNFGCELAAADVSVVSGLAVGGIDCNAHRGALVSGGISVAVRPCGLAADYGASRTGLVDWIAESGLVLSEHRPTAPPSQKRSEVSRRLVASLSLGTVVVEAREESPCRVTARLAAELGRVVMAVPGPVGSKVSVGCHQLVRHEGALLVTTGAEVFEACELADDPWSEGAVR